MKKWVFLFVLLPLLWATYKVSLPLPPGKVHQRIYSEQIGWNTVKPSSLISHGEYALGLPGVGIVMKSSNQKSVPIASLTKMMTAVLVIEAHPLQGNESGPLIHFSQKDVQLLHKDIANGDSVVNVQSGETMTERQALLALLIPSGDNIATKLAEWVSGSVPEFVTKMNATAKKLGMVHTHYADTSGVNPKTTSNAQDQWIMAAKFMTFPVLEQIVAMKSAHVPVAGTIYNYNKLLGKDGIVGIKTGNTSQAGGNLASAKRLTLNNKTRLLIGIVLGQKSSPPLAGVLKVTPKLLRLGKENLRRTTVVRKGQVVGDVTFPWGQRIPLVATKTLAIETFPGERISRTLHFLSGYNKLKRGAAAGTLAVKTSNHTYTIKVQAASTYHLPSLLWKVAH